MFGAFAWLTASIIVLIGILMILHRLMQIHATPHISYAAHIPVVFANGSGDGLDLVTPGAVVFKSPLDSPWEIQFSVLSGGHYIQFSLPRSEIEYIATHKSECWKSELAYVSVGIGSDVPGITYKNNERTRLIFDIKQPNESLNIAFTIPLRQMHKAMRNWARDNPLRDDAWKSSIDDLMSELETATE